MRRLLAALAAAATFNCGSARNYVDPSGPRYAGRFARAGPEAPEIRFATFNIRFSREVDRAIELLRNAPALRGADVVALQEMDQQGVERIASALGLDYVYYPAVVHPEHGKDFGNALLSRRPIAEDRKIILPHLSRTNGAQRAAVAGTVSVAGRAVRLYSVHLSTRTEIGAAAQRDQAEAVLADAARFERVILAGDMNGRSIAAFFEGRGLLWATKDVKRTLGLLAWDHVAVRGLETKAVGVVPDNLGASDHRPVWAVLTLE